MFATLAPKLFESLDGRIARHDMVRNPTVWFMYALVFAVYAIATVGVALLVPSFDAPPTYVFAAVLAAVSVVAFGSKPPPIDSLGNHAVIASAYVGVTLGAVAFGDHALVALGPMACVGPWTAIRLQRHRDIAWHLVAASALVSLLVLFGLVDRSAAFAIATLVPCTWVLAFCVMAIWEAVERQGEELQALIRRDPLTGVGNRRMLDECLERGLARHAKSGNPLSVLVLDLNGFKALNDAVGHDAGDALLRLVASALQSVAREHDKVARQGGDEFCVVLPSTSAEQARGVEEAIRTALAGIEQGAVPITTGIGIATFPADGVDAKSLLQVADRRLAEDKQQRPPVPVLDLPDLMLGAPRLQAETPEAHDSGESFTLIKRVSRRELALNPYTWRATAVVYGAYTAITATLCLTLEGNRAWAPLVVVLCAAMTFWTLTREPPATDTLRNHVVLASTYVLSALMMVAMPEAATVAFGAMAFIGPLPPQRTADSRLIPLHYLVATVVFGAIAGCGLVDETTGLALLFLAFGTWGLGLACIMILEAAERQGDQLEELVRRDPLTGLGNRRLLDEQLEVELSRHSRTRRPLTLLAFDLNGFKALNDDVGHAAGDELLRQVGEILTSVSGSDAIVTRQGGDEFCVVLPNTSRTAAVRVADAVRTALAAIDAHGHQIGTGIGMASYPRDSRVQDELLRIADERLRASKQAESGRQHGDRRFTRSARTVV